MFNNLYFLLSVIISIFACNAHFTSFQYATLASALKVRHHAECLFLVSSGLFNVGQDLVDLIKILSESGTVVGSFMAEEMLKVSQEYKCKGNRPIYAMSADDTTRRVLQLMVEIPSYPRWMIFFESFQSIEEFFRNIYVPFNCEVLVAQSFDSDIQLTEVYQVAAGFPLKQLHFGTWSLETGLNTSHDVVLYRRRNQLDGLTLKAVSCNYEPDSMILRNKFGRMRIGGFYGWIWNTFETEFNFSTSVTEAWRGVFGSLVNGSWTGMVGMLVSKDVDAAVGGFAYEDERMNVVDFLSPIVIERELLLIRKPEAAKFQWSGFLTPFTSRLWVVIIGSIVICSILVTHSYRIGFRHGIEMDGLAGNGDYSMSGSLFCVHGLYCQQGPSSTPRSISCRMILLIVGISSTVVLAAYSGSLTSFITVPQLALPYETIEEYIDDPSFDFGMTQNAVWIYLHDPRNRLFTKLHKILFHRIHLQPTDRWMGLKKLCSSEKPFGLFSYRLYHASLLELKCEIVAVPEHLVAEALSMVVTKGSPYQELFNYKIKSLWASGVLKRMVQQAWPAAIINVDNAFLGVELYHVVPVITILAAGVLVSALLLAGEALIRYADRIMA